MVIIRSLRFYFVWFLYVFLIFLQINSEPEVYGDLHVVFKFKMIMGRADNSNQFRKMIIRHKRIGYNLNVKRQSACLVIYPITIDNFAALFNCTPADRASDSLMALT